VKESADGVGKNRGVLGNSQLVPHGVGIGASVGVVGSVGSIGVAGSIGVVGAFDAVDGTDWPWPEPISWVPPPDTE
jgi:hypothetical protein